MLSVAVLSSSIAIAMASQDSVASSDATTARPQQLWYPAFSTDYESGRCTTSPSPSIAALALGSFDPDASSLAQIDRESCCETWFPAQELCGCLGGCPEDETDATTLSPNMAEPLLADERGMWYPKFDVSYEVGACLRSGVDHMDDPPSYYTIEGGFLHQTLDACCDRWFGNQEGGSCMGARREISVILQPTSSLAGINMTSEAKNVDIEQTNEVYQVVRSPAHIAQDTQ